METESKLKFKEKFTAFRLHIKRNSLKSKQHTVYRIRRFSFMGCGSIHICCCMQLLMSYTASLTLTKAKRSMKNIVVFKSQSASSDVTQNAKTHVLHEEFEVSLSP